jgi:hypothetical protein
MKNPEFLVEASVNNADLVSVMVLVLVSLIMSLMAIHVAIQVMAAHVRKTSVDLVFVFE